MSESHSENARIARHSGLVERAFAEQSWLPDDVFARAREGARERALRALAGWEDGEDAPRTAELLFAAEMFCRARAELARHPREAALLIARLSDAGLSQMALAREVLMAPELAALPPARAVEIELGLLLGFAPLQGASLWTMDGAGRPRCAHAAGEGASSSAARKLAGRLIAGEAIEAGARAELFGLPLRRAQQPVGALVARAEPRQRKQCRAMLLAAQPTLEAVLERDALLRTNAASERALAETSERRLTRLGFDLHDGPLQELLLLASDLRLFRDQLGGVLGKGRDRELLGGRLDDLDARLVALEDGLRQISNSVHAGALSSRPLAGAVEEIAEAFNSRAGIEATLAFEGDASTLSASQRIALLSVLGEALNNVREHSQATAVAIDVSVNDAGVQARVLDDGRGFDVEAALLGAARRGRIGLAGIHERVRLLGGRCVVESRPGGPTAVSLSLPRWEPLAGGGHGEELVA